MKINITEETRDVVMEALQNLREELKNGLSKELKHQLRLEYSSPRDYNMGMVDQYKLHINRVNAAIEKFTKEESTK
jgi:hypothetical protein